MNALSNAAICIAGKNLIGVDVLAGAAARYRNVLCLPNRDDTGEDGWQPSLRRAAHEMNVRVVELEDIYDLDELCFLSVEYAHLIRPDRFRSARLFNVHFSLLPKYRGCNTAVWPLLNGESEHGVTLHLIDAGMDTGAIIDQRSFDLRGMTAHDAYMACQRVGADLALEWLPRLVDNDFTARDQAGESSTYYRRDLDYGLKEIDLSESTEQIIRRIRAFTFPAYQLPTLNGREILDASIEPVTGWERHRTADGQISLRFSLPARD